MGNVLCEPAWLETRKMTFPVTILLLCSSYNIVEYEGESSAVPEKSQVIWDRFCVNGVCMAQTLLMAELWSSYIVVNAGAPFAKFPLESSLWNTCSGSPGNAFRAPFGILWSFVVLFALHLTCLFVSQRCAVVYLDHQGISNLLTCKYSSCYLQSFCGRVIYK